MKNKNVICASNVKQRNVAKKWLCDDLIVKNAPFMVEKKDSKGSYETKELPCVYIKNPQGHITNVLERLDRYKQTQVAKNIGAILARCCLQYWRNIANYIAPIL